MAPRFTIAPLLLALAGLLPAQVDPETADRIKQEGLQNSKVMQTLDFLANSIGERLTGSDNFAIACNWAKAEFEKMGLQNVHLDEWGEFPVIWNRGQWSGRVLKPEALELEVASPAWTAGTKGRVSGVLRRMPKDLAELEALQGSLSKSYLWGPRPRAQGNSSEAIAASRALNQALDRAVEADGCLGFVMRSSERDARYPTRMRVFGNYRVQPNRLPTLPQIIVRQDQSDKIEALLSGPDEVVIEFDMRNRFRPGPVKVHNVVADIVGTEKPDEYVIVCGHLDSWHMATGTTDNGTGSAATLEAARILSTLGVKPRRTIRFILWGGEEQGLLGSGSYVRRNRTSMDKVSAVYNHDTGTNWTQNLSVTPAMVADLETALAQIMTMEAPDPAHEGPVFELKRVANLTGGGSDHASFLAAGVPGWSIGLAGSSDYFGYTWHTQWDTFDVAVPEYMRHSATVVALAALGTANLPNMVARDGVGRSVGTDAAPVLEGSLGVELDGMTFKSVATEGLAHKAGIRAGDTLIKVNGEAVDNWGSLMRHLRVRDGNEPPRLTLKRGDGEASIILEPFIQPRRRGGRETAPAPTAPQRQDPGQGIGR